MLEHCLAHVEWKGRRLLHGEASAGLLIDSGVEKADAEAWAGEADAGEQRHQTRPGQGPVGLWQRCMLVAFAVECSPSWACGGRLAGAPVGDAAGDGSVAQLGKGFGEEGGAHGVRWGIGAGLWEAMRQTWSAEAALEDAREAAATAVKNCS